jgi:ABC-type transport system involved in multi-copper enzyme maturation permease subunit
MWTVFVHTLKESIHRRIALALIVVAIFFFAIQIGFTHFSRDANGELMVLHSKSSAPIAAKAFVTTDVFPASILILANMWVLLTLLATTSLLTSYMEKGWVELLLSKGTPRWQIFAGRYLGTLGLFIVTAFIMNVLCPTYFALRAGVPLRPYLVALSFLLLSFLGALSLLVLVSTAHPNAGLLVLVVFLEFIVSGMLAGREQLAKAIPWKWVTWLMDWMYRILPKHEELNRMATRYSLSHTVATWFPVWTTAVFVVVASTWAFWRFERKAF